MVVTAAIWALFVLIATWPPARGGRWGFAVFLLTMTVNEIPLVLLAVFVASAALTLVPSSAPPEWPAVVLIAVVVVGLVHLQIRARSVRPAIEAALADGLGAGRRDPLPAPRAPSRTSSWIAGILLPFQRHRHDVERLRNLPYGPDREQRLDVYRGRGRRSACPVLVHLHGGGFTQGGRSREGVALLNQLAAHGWLCVSADYRLRARGSFPNSLVDAKRAVAWVREHAADYGGDPARIVLVGSSAGGHLAVSAALTPDRPELQPGFADVDTSVAAVVVLYGYLGPRTTDPTSSPAALARPHTPPMLILHGARDTMVPPAGPRSVAATLRTASRSPVVWAELPDAQHSFDFFASVRARLVADEVEAFLDWVWTRDG